MIKDILFGLLLLPCLAQAMEKERAKKDDNPLYIQYTLKRSEDDFIRVTYRKCSEGYKIEKVGCYCDDERWKSEDRQKNFMAVKAIYDSQQKRGRTDE